MTLINTDKILYLFCGVCCYQLTLKSYFLLQINTDEIYLSVFFLFLVHFLDFKCVCLWGI